MTVADQSNPDVIASAPRPTVADRPAIDTVRWTDEDAPAYLAAAKAAIEGMAPPTLPADLRGLLDALVAAQDARLEAATPGNQAEWSRRSEAFARAAHAVAEWHRGAAVGCFTIDGARQIREADQRLREALVERLGCEKVDNETLLAAIEARTHTEEDGRWLSVDDMRAMKDEARQRAWFGPTGQPPTLTIETSVEEGYHLILDDGVVIARSKSRRQCERVVGALAAAATPDLSPPMADLRLRIDARTRALRDQGGLVSARDVAAQLRADLATVPTTPADPVEEVRACRDVADWSRSLALSAINQLERLLRDADCVPVDLLRGRIESLRARLGAGPEDAPPAGSIVQVVGPAADGTAANVGMLGVVADGPGPAIPDAGGVHVHFQWHDRALQGSIARERLRIVGVTDFLPAPEDLAAPGVVVTIADPAELRAALGEACELIDSGSAHCSDCGRGAHAPEGWWRMASAGVPVEPGESSGGASAAAGGE